jgi:hypothetical protein
MAKLQSTELRRARPVRNAPNQRASFAEAQKALFVAIDCGAVRSG